MYVEGGIHAREWMSPAVVTYFINELTVNAANNMDMLENLDWFVSTLIGVTNLDSAYTAVEKRTSESLLYSSAGYYKGCAFLISVNS